MKSIEQTLNWILPILNGRQIPFYITGGLAAHLYGATRPLNDIDIDLPIEHLNSLLPELRSYLEFGPERYRDSTWDMCVASLNYEGQLVDLSGDANPLVHNRNTGEWDLLEMNFSDVIWIRAFGCDLPVQNPKDLVSYKLKIKYDEDKHLEDVRAIQSYCKAHESIL